ncbi:hypothetical protein D917_02760 [Trichinella nativa]|uniref:Uncharacterized protein n=1 Tax=Trichinella nativa TaxID=6335 RepID=A0A1Y3EFP0_9BILA|nr:hypothetical protein D917_02760 [Trichinella nativa]
MLIILPQPSSVRSAHFWSFAFERVHASGRRFVNNHNHNHNNIIIVVVVGVIIIDSRKWRNPHTKLTNGGNGSHNERNSPPEFGHEFACSWLLRFLPLPSAASAFITLA